MKKGLAQVERGEIVKVPWGDLYHYPEERTLNRIPLKDSDPKQTAALRTALEDSLKKTGAAPWIQHDIGANRKFRKSPEYDE